MLALVAAAAQLAYSFPIGTIRRYDVQVVFDGFIPILGGQEGKIIVNLGVDAKGIEPKDGAPQVWSELKEMKIVFNGGTLPFTAKNAQDYFPPTTISMTPQGHMLATNAPDVKLPVKLPGLDIKRFPDITYLPLELPEGEMVMGKSWSFKKAFGTSDVLYTVMPREITEEAAKFDVKLSQTYEMLENESVEVVTDPKEAFATVRTDVIGAGTATFDRKLGVFRNVDISADANSVVTELATKKARERKLKTKLLIKLRRG